MKPILLFLLFALAVLPVHGDDARLPALILQYRADVDLLARHTSNSGDSSAALNRHRKLLNQWLKRVEALNFKGLSSEDQVDAVLLRNQIEKSIMQLDERKETRKELAPWLPFYEVIDALGDARMLGGEMVPEEAAGTLAPVAISIKEMQGALKAAKEKKEAPASGGKRKPKLKPSVVLPTSHQALLASEATDALAAQLRRWFENYDGFVPEFGWWMKQPHDAAAKALTDYSKYLREEIAGVKGKSKDEKGGSDGGEEELPLLGKVIGAQLLQRHLDHEFIPYTPQELIDLAEIEFAWCEDQMRLAAKEMGLGDDWEKALQRVKLQSMKPGEQETFVRAEAQRAIDFVKDRDLVSIPPNCEEWWGTRMLSLREQRNMPYAAYSGHDMLIAYANEGMKHEDKMMSMRGNNRPFSRNVIPHELIPGHHLQKYMAARERPYRGMFSTPFYVEGWALYWEMRLFDLKYQPTPEDRIGALFWRMHRCARIIVTLKFHLGQMKPDEMVNFLTDRVGHEKFGATSEVRRFIKGDYSPLYQCGYLLGGIQLIALHKELVIEGGMAEKQFHDAILKLGPIPVELVRASLLKQPLESNFKTQWRFDESSSR